MNESQKRYTVMQISNYKNKAENLDRDVEIDRLFLYGSLIILIAAQQTLDAYGNDLTAFWYTFMIFTKYSSIAFGLTRLKDMIGNLSKKAGLENMAVDLEYQMKIADLADKDNNSTKGHRLW